MCIIPPHNLIASHVTLPSSSSSSSSSCLSSSASKLVVYTDFFFPAAFFLLLYFFAYIHLHSFCFFLLSTALYVCVCFCLSDCVCVCSNLSKHSLVWELRDPCVWFVVWEQHEQQIHHTHSCAYTHTQHIHTPQGLIAETTCNSSWM